MNLRIIFNTHATVITLLELLTRGEASAPPLKEKNGLLPQSIDNPEDIFWIVYLKNSEDVFSIQKMSSGLSMPKAMQGLRTDCIE
jgi:hypothetical protein